MFSSMATITSEAWTNQSPKNVNTYPHTYLLSSKTMRGSLFPLLPLRVKCQNHERVPISLFPLFWWSMPCHLVKTWATKIGEIGTLSWFWHFIKGKHSDGFPYLTPKGEVPKPWEGPYLHYFPYFGGPCISMFWKDRPWSTGEIGFLP